MREEFDAVAFQIMLLEMHSRSACSRLRALSLIKEQSTDWSYYGEEDRPSVMYKKAFRSV